MKNRFKMALDHLPRARNRDVAAAGSIASAVASGGSETSVAAVLGELDQGNGTSHFNSIATYASLLRRCVKAKSLDDGRMVHAHLTGRGLGSSVVLCELLVQMYGKCKCLGDARRVFDTMVRRSVYAWNLMLAAYVDAGLPWLALDLYHGNMDVQPDHFTYSTLLSACSELGALQEGKAIHARMIQDVTLISDAVSQNSLVTMYARCRRLEDARSVFDAIRNKEVGSWNAMISAYTQQGQCRDAIDVYRVMDIEPNGVTFATTLAACAELGGAEGLELGRSIHSKVVARDLRANVYVDTALLSMYANCKSLEEAVAVFESMEHRNIVSWTAMISAYAQNCENRRALRLFCLMDLEGFAPNAYTFSCALGACANLGDLGLGMVIFGCSVVKGYELDISLQNAMINLHGKCGELDHAKSLFDSMIVKNDISWNAMIAAYVQRGCNHEALELYHHLEGEGVEPNGFMYASVAGACGTVVEVQGVDEKFASSRFRADQVVHNALIRAYAKCGNLDLARRAFDDMPTRDGVSWNGMITSYVQGDHPEDALELYFKMKASGVKPTSVTFSSVLTACLTVSSLEVGKLIHEDAASCGVDRDVGVGTALVNLYAKFSNLRTAREVFDTMNQRSVVTWSVMIAAYAQNGETGIAIDVYRALFLDGTSPDEVSFVCLFSAYSHGGLLEEGRAEFLSMHRDHGVEPTIEHYLCLVDLLVRSARLEDARELILEMPFEPDADSWMTLLGGCKVQANKELGEFAAERVFELHTSVSAPYILLSCILTPRDDDDHEEF